MAGDFPGELARAGWRVQHDVPWPGRPRVTIDHVVVGRPGVFVVAATTVAHAAGAARAISSHLRTARCPVTPVLCLARDEEIYEERGGVVVCTPSTIAKVLQAREPVLDDVQVQRLAQDLADHRLPVMRAAAAPSRARPARGVTLLVGALTALGAAILLVSRPDVVTGAVEDVATWVAERIDDVG